MAKPEQRRETGPKTVLGRLRNAPMIDAALAAMYAPLQPLTKRVHLHRRRSRHHRPQDVMVPAGFTASSGTRGLLSTDSAATALPRGEGQPGFPTARCIAAPCATALADVLLLGWRAAPLSGLCHIRTETAHAVRQTGDDAGQPPGSRAPGLPRVSHFRRPAGERRPDCGRGVRRGSHPGVKAAVPRGESRRPLQGSRSFRPTQRPR